MHPLVNEAITRLSSRPVLSTVSICDKSMSHAYSKESNVLKAQGLILCWLFPRKYRVPAKGVEGTTDIFSRDSRFILELAHHSVNYSNASFLTLCGLAYTFPSEFPNYI